MNSWLSPAPPVSFPFAGCTPRSCPGKKSAVSQFLVGWEQVLRKHMEYPRSSAIIIRQLATETYCTFQEKGPRRRRRISARTKCLFCSKVFVTNLQFDQFRFFFRGFQVLEIYRFFLVVMPPHTWHSKYIRNVHRWCELIRNFWSPEVPDRIERHSHDGTWTH